MEGGVSFDEKHPLLGFEEKMGHGQQELFLSTEMMELKLRNKG